ncbi:unnamed protein product, partial [Closterium sp. NIES-53]
IRLTTDPPHHRSASPQIRLTTDPPHHRSASPQIGLTTDRPHHRSASPQIGLTTDRPHHRSASPQIGLTTDWPQLPLPHPQPLSLLPSTAFHPPNLLPLFLPLPANHRGGTTNRLESFPNISTTADVTLFEGGYWAASFCRQPLKALRVHLEEFARWALAVAPAKSRTLRRREETRKVHHHHHRHHHHHHHHHHNHNHHHHHHHHHHHQPNPLTWRCCPRGQQQCWTRGSGLQQQAQWWWGKWGRLKCALCAALLDQRPPLLHGAVRFTAGGGGRKGRWTPLGISETSQKLTHFTWACKPSDHRYSALLSSTNDHSYSTVRCGLQQEGQVGEAQVDGF